MPRYRASQRAPDSAQTPRRSKVTKIGRCKSATRRPNWASYRIRDRNHWELAQTKTDGTCSRAPPGPYSRTKLTRLFAPIFFFRSAENIGLRNFVLEPRDGAAENMPKTFFSEPWALSGAVQECSSCSESPEDDFPWSFDDFTGVDHWEKKTII